MVCNNSVREQTGQKMLELTVQECRLRWLGHVQKMNDERIASQVLRWVPEDRRKRGRSRITWQDVVNKDIKEGGLTWEEAMSLTANKC